jgi:hypothetical protein
MVGEPRLLHNSSLAGGSVLALNASLEIALNSLPVIITSSSRIPAEACFSLAFEPRFCGKRLRLQLLRLSWKVALVYRHAGLFSPQHEQISQLMVYGSWHFSSPMSGRLKPWWHDCQIPRSFAIWLILVKYCCCRVFFLNENFNTTCNRPFRHMDLWMQ